MSFKVILVLLNLTSLFSFFCIQKAFFISPAVVSGEVAVWKYEGRREVLTNATETLCDLPTYLADRKRICAGS